MKTKKYDVILYGASGFTGRLTVRYFRDHAPPGLRWAIAGRSRSKLAKVKREVLGEGSPIDILPADGNNADAIESLVQSARVVLTTAGPFALYGRHLIAACARNGVDYVDLNGETAFVREMIDQHAEQAEASGAKIIPSCGFDAVPSDLGVILTVNHIRENLHSGTHSIKGAFSISFAGGFNGGTLYTLMTLFDSGAWQRMQNPGVLIPSQIPGVTMVSDRYRASYDKDLKAWTAPFMMGFINTRVVNRSAALSTGWGEAYGNDFQYSECHKIGSWWNPLPSVAITLTLKMITALGAFAPARAFMKAVGPAPGKGPSQKAMDNGFFRLEMIGVSESGQQVRTLMSADGDPGNKVTVTCLCESALSLAEDRERLPGGEGRSGFLTPATGLGMVLLKRLKRAGFTISTEIMQEA